MFFMYYVASIFILSLIFCLIDVISFEHAFKSWLLDGGADDVHLIIQFPSVGGSGKSCTSKALNRPGHTDLEPPI